MNTQLRRGTTLLLIVFMVSFSLIALEAFSAMPSTTLKSKYVIVGQEKIPREECLIVDIDGGRQAAPKVQNPFIIGATGMGGGAWICAIELLYYVNIVNGTIDWWLATGLKYDPDYMGLTLYLRKGVTWSDGEPFTAEDVVFTYQMLLNYGPQLNWGALVQEWVEDVKALDKYTVYFRFKKPCPRFHLTILSSWGWPPPIVPKHIWEKVDPTKFDNYPPVWTGPYELVEATETRFVWKRRDDYWAAKVLGPEYLPKPKYVIYTWPGPEEKRVAEMARHMLDSICDIDVGAFLELKKKNPYVRAWHKDPPYTFLDPCPRYIMINTRRYPWNMSEVRWAVSRAINRTRIIKVAYKGTTTPCEILIPAYKWHVDRFISKVEDIIKKYDPCKYDPEETIRIFESLGFKRGPDGVWVTPNGTRLSLTILAPAPWIEIKRIAMFVAEDLKKVGIDAVVKVLEGAPFSDAWNRNNFEAMSAWMCYSASDPYYLFEYYHSRYYAPTGNVSAANHEGYRNPELDRLVDELAVIPPEDPRVVDYYRRLTEIIMRDLPSIPITQAVKLVPFDYYYWEGWPTAENPYCAPCNWWPIFKLVLHRIKPTGRRPPTETLTQQYMWIIAIVIVVILILVGLLIYRRRRRRA